MSDLEKEVEKAIAEFVDKHPEAMSHIQLIEEYKQLKKRLSQARQLAQEYPNTEDFYDADGEFHRYECRISQEDWIIRLKELLGVLEGKGLGKSANSVDGKPKARKLPRSDLVGCGKDKQVNYEPIEERQASESRELVRNQKETQAYLKELKIRRLAAKLEEKETEK
jgi:hypothetical protein